MKFTFSCWHISFSTHSIAGVLHSRYTQIPLRQTNRSHRIRVYVCSAFDISVPTDSLVFLRDFSIQIQDEYRNRLAEPQNHKKKTFDKKPIDIPLPHK